MEAQASNIDLWMILRIVLFIAFIIFAVQFFYGKRMENQTPLKLSEDDGDKE